MHVLALLFYKGDSPHEDMETAAPTENTPRRYPRPDSESWH